MRRRRAAGREQSVFANPVLIGAMTVLATIVVVTLAYQANNGLPFVPKYSLHVQVRDASELTHGAEVHMGGSLVGAVESISPGRDAAGQPIAVLNLQLDKVVQPLPVNSQFDVRLKGAIGLKYLQVIPGNARRTWVDGATVPLSQSSAEVDLDQVLAMFDKPTRAALAASTVGFSNALAGRGSDINDAIGAFLPLVRDLGPVARNLSSSKTDLGGFFRGLESFSAALVPVAQTQAMLYSNLDTTFTALAGVAYPYLQNWISQTPPTFNRVIADSPVLQPFLTETAELFGRLQPGVDTLPATAPVLAEAFAAGTHTLPQTMGPQGLNAQLLSLSRALDRYGQTVPVQLGLSRLTLTAHDLRSPLAFLTPVQATCNYASLFLRNIASTLAEPLITGTALRFNLVTIDDVVGGEAVPSQKPYLTPTSNQASEHGPLHVNPYPNTDSPGQTPECAAGNEPYSSSSALIGNPPGNVGLHTEQTSRSAK